MKIGILTHPLETNYGGLLQAFALQKVLRDLGFDAITIDRHNKNQYPSFTIHILSFVKRLIGHYFLNKKVSPHWNPFIDNKTYKVLSQNTQKFIEKNIQKTRFVWSDDLEEIDKEYQFDIYVVGSDQVWLPTYCPASFLDFVHREGVVKVFYAASCGAVSFVDDKIIFDKCVKLADDFKAISVREQTLIDLSERYLKKTATWVLDPTLLILPSDYVNAVRKIECSPSVFAYILDNNAFKSQVIQEVCTLCGSPLYYANVKEYYQEGSGQNVEDCIFPSVDSWISQLNSARFVVTDSFHGTAMTILFNKQFVVINNKKRGSERIKSLLAMFGLEDRIVNTIEDLRDQYSSQINFEEVNNKISVMRENSLNFIIKNLKMV